MMTPHLMMTANQKEMKKTKRRKMRKRRKSSESPSAHYDDAADERYY